MTNARKDISQGALPGGRVSPSSHQTGGTTSGVRGKFLANALANALNFGVSLAIGIWFTPYLLHSLGNSLYGLIPLTNTVVSYLAVATAGLQVAVSRFVSMALERGDNVMACRVFNTALVGLWSVAGFVGLPIALLSWFGDRIIRVPAENARDLRWLFAFCGISFLLTTVTGAFGVSQFYRNRFDLQAGLSLASNLLRVGIIILAFSVSSPSLCHVGIAIALASVVPAVGNVISWRQLTPELLLSPSLCDRSELRRILGTAGWVLVSQVGSILLIGIDLLVVNRMFGAIANTHYALALQWSVLLRGAAATLAGLFASDITAFYAREDTVALVEYARRSVKFMGLLLALPVGLICGFGRPLVATWVGGDLVGIAPLMIVLTFPLALNLGYLPLNNISIAANRVKVPGLVQIAAGILNLILAVGLAKYTALGIYGVATAGGLVLILRNLVFTPLYASHILNVPKSIFLKELWPCLLASFLVFIGAWAFTCVCQPVGWIQLGIAGTVVGGLYATAVYCLLLSRDERSEVWRKIAGVLSLLRMKCQGIVRNDC